MKNFLSKYKNNILFIIGVSIILAILTILFASSVASPIYIIFRSDGFDNDPQYFLHIGKLMTQGQKPYIDIFDHKGLYIFYYHYLANVLGGKIGLFLLELVLYSFFYVGFILALKKLFDKDSVVYVSIAIYLSIFILVFQGGADIDLQLPFISFLLYFYIKGIKNEDFSSFMIGNILAGILAGIDINLRMSDAIVPFTAVIYYAYYSLSKKKYMYAFRDGLLCVASIVITSLPPLLLAVSNGYLSIMIETLFGSNAGYVLSTRLFLNHAQISAYLMLLVSLPIFIISLIYLRNRVNKQEWMFYLLSISITWPIEFIICLFPHYFLPMLPFLVIFFARVITNFKIVKENNVVKKSIAIFSISLSIFSMALFPSFYYLGNLYQIDKEINNYITSVVREDKENVLVIDYGISFYLNNQYITKTKHFSSQAWHYSFEESVLEDTVSYIKSGQVKYVITRTYDKLKTTNKKFVDEVIVKTSNLSIIESDNIANKYIDIYKVN